MRPEDPRDHSHPKASPPAWLFAVAILAATVGLPLIGVIAIVRELEHTDPDAYGECRTAAQADQQLITRSALEVLPSGSVRDLRWQNSADYDCEFRESQVSAPWDRADPRGAAQALAAHGWKRVNPDLDSALTKVEGDSELTALLGNTELRVVARRPSAG